MPHDAPTATALDLPRALRPRRVLASARRGLIAIAIALASASGATVASAEPDLEVARSRYIFLGNESRPPLVYKEGGQPIGVVVDLARAIADKALLDAEVRATAWSDAQRDVQTGAADALLLVNKDPERERLYDFSDPLLDTEFSIFRKDDRIDVNGVESLRGRTVGVEAGGYSALLMARYPQVHQRTVPDLNVGFRLLCEGQLDALLTDRWAGEFALAQGKVTGVRVVEEPVDRTSSCIAVRKGNDDLLVRINDGLRRARVDGTMQRILDRWKGQHVVYVLERDYGWYRLSMALAVVALALAAVVYFDARKIARAKRALAEEARRTRAMLEDLPLPVRCSSLDPDGRIVFVNDQFVETFGYTLADVPTVDEWARRAYPDEPYRTDNRAWWNAAIHDAIKRRARIPHRELSVTTRDGTTLDVLCTASISGDQLIVSFLDVTERKRLEASVRELAFRDPLTHLANRRLMEEHLGQAMATCRRSGLFGALLVIDLDNFKPLNDAHGHGTGDRLLVEVARRLTSSVRQCDVVARFGGDEFVVVLGGVDADEAVAQGGAGTVAEKIARAVSAPYLLKVGAEESPLDHRCSASIGVALFGRDDLTRDQLFSRADRAMYQAKKAGRGQVRFHAE